MITAAARLAGVVLVAQVLAASPALAHGGQGAERPPAGNYRTTITSVAPETDGLEVRVIEAGSRIELRHRGAAQLVVLGYEGEPYLRVGPDGVFMNVRSPAAYLNTDRFARTPIPPEADGSAEPSWRWIADGSTVRWHDHRAHWMGRADPPSVAADPSRRQIVFDDWVIPAVVGGRAVRVTGDLEWVPGPPRWPWLVGAVITGALIVAAVRRWRRTGPWVAGLVLLGATASEAVGVWAGSVGTALDKTSEAMLPGMAWFLLVGGLTRLGRAPREATLLIGGAGAGLAWLFGVSDLSWLGASQLPTAIPAPVARAAVSVSLATGGGLCAHAIGDRLVRPSRRPTPVLRGTRG